MNKWRDLPAIRGMELPADLVSELDDDALLLALDGASEEDRAVLLRRWSGATLKSDLVAESSQVGPSSAKPRNS